ncbi:unnamed protein product [Rotaria socialis]
MHCNLHYFVKSTTWVNDRVFMITDNENKMKSAFKDNVERIGCSAHYINKVLEHSFMKESIHSPTLHLVIPYKQFLINLSNDTDDKQLIFPVKKYIGEELENYWVVEDVHYVATMLHPNLKSFNYTPQQKYHAETLLKLEFEKHQQLEQRISLSNNNNNTSSSTSSNRSDQIFNFTLKILVLFEIENLKYGTENSSQSISNSKSNFKIRNRNRNEKTNSKSNCKNKFKIIDSGNTITNRRTRLDANKVNQLLFIRRKLLTLREIFPPTIEQA